MKIYKTIQEYSTNKNISLQAWMDRLKASKVHKLIYEGKKLWYIDIKDSIKYLVIKI